MEGGKDPVILAVQVYEEFCETYYHLKSIESKTEEELNEYLKVKKYLKDDITDSIYINALKRSKSDRVFLKSLKRFSKSSTALLKMENHQEFSQYLCFTLSLFDQCSFEFLKESTKRYYCVVASKLLKVGDTERNELLNKLLRNLETLLYSCTNKVLTCAVFLKELVSAFTDDCVGGSILPEDELCSRRARFQENELVRVLIIVVKKLDSVKNARFESSTQLQLLREQLLLILLSVLRSSFDGKMCDKHLKVITNKVSNAFRPPPSWHEIVFELQIHQKLFRMLKNGGSDLYTELLLLNCITQIGTLQVRHHNNLEQAEDFINGFTLRISEVIEKFSHNFMPKTIFFTTLALHRFNSTSIFYDNLNIRFIKLFSLLKHKKALLKLFSRLMQQIHLTNFQEKVHLKSLLLFTSFLKEIYVLTNTYLVFDATSDLNDVFLFIETIYDEFLNYLLIQPLGKNPPKSGPARLVGRVAVSEAKNTALPRFSFMKVLSEKLINDGFFKLLYVKFSAVTEQFASLLAFRKSVPEQSQLKSASFLDLLENATSLLTIAKHLYFTRFIGDFDKAVGFYFKRDRSSQEATLKFTNAFRLWAETDDPDAFTSFVTYKNVAVDPFFGAVCLIFAIGAFFLSLLSHDCFRNVGLSALNAYIKCLSKLSKMSDDVNLFNFDFVSVSEEEHCSEAAFTTNQRSLFCRLIVNHAYRILEPLLKVNINSCCRCIKVIKNCFRYNKCFLLNDSAFVKRFQRDLCQSIINILTSSSADDIILIADLTGIVFYSSLFLPSDLERESAFHELGSVLRLQEFRDCSNIVWFNRNSSLQTYQSFRRSQKTVLCGVIGIVKHFPKEIYYRDKYRRLLEFFVNPVICYLPLIWNYSSIYSDFVYQYATFCIETMNVFSAFPHKAIEIADFSKMIKMTTHSYRSSKVREIPFVSVEEANVKSNVLLSNHAVMLALGQKIIDFLLTANYIDDSFSSLKIHNRLLRGVTNIVHGLLENNRIEYLHNSNLLCQFSNLIAEYLGVCVAKKQVEVSNLYLYSYVLLHGLYSKPKNKVVYAKAVTAILRLIRLNRNKVNYHDFEYLVTRLFYYLYYSFLNTTDDRLVIYELYPVIVEMMVNYFSALRDELERILTTTNLLKHDIESILKVTDNFFKMLSYEIESNFKDSENFQRYLEWMCCLRKNYTYIVIVPPS